MAQTRRRRDRQGDDGSAVAFAASVVTMATLATAFGALALGIDWFWVAFPVGFGGVLPAVVGYVRRRSADREPTEARANTERAGADTDSPDAALATLRRRYARGDLTDDQFERRVERLLETEETADTVVSIRED